MIIRSTIGFMRDEHWALELAIDEKQNKIKHKESEIRDMKSSFQTSQKIRYASSSSFFFVSVTIDASTPTVQTSKIKIHTVWGHTARMGACQKRDLMRQFLSEIKYPYNPYRHIRVIWMVYVELACRLPNREKGDTHHRHRFINITSEFDTSDHLFTCKLCFSTGVVDYSDSQALEAYGTDSEAWLSVFLAWVCSFDAWIGL
ncbi:hypothetical protein R6Q59_001814 [Mikania micrantha]